MKQHSSAAVRVPHRAAHRNPRQNTKPAVELELSWTTTILIGLLGAMFLFTSFPA